MGKLIFIVALLPSMAMAAEQQKKPAAEQKKPAQATANPCAQYGAGFVQVQGTNTCVKLTGSIRVEFGR